MGWTRHVRRAVRPRRRLDVEALEVRTLLSTQPTPAGVSMTLSNGNTDFTSIIGAADARSTYGVDGTGTTVAVIDTGVNYDNSAFGGGGLGPGHKVVFGYDFADNSSNATAQQQHGTAVAGLIASNAPSDPGIAPGADIADLRVFNNNGASSFNAVASALQWVINNYQKYNITAVNISLSDGSNYQQNWLAQDGSVGAQVTKLIGQLDALNIPVITATGNSFNGTQGQDFPSIVPDTISVTATDASDQIVSDAQRLGTAEGGIYATKLAAPGESLTAPVEGNNFGTVTGTSFAAPQVTGAVVLLQQIYEQRFGHLPTVNDLDQWLQEGAVPVHDSVTGITVGRLDIPSAAALIPGAPSSQPATSSPSTTSINPAPQVLAPTPTPAPVTIPTTAPPPQNNTPPPQNNTTPQSNTTPPQNNTPTTPSNSGSSVNVSYNGQLVENTSDSGSGSLTSLVSLFASFFKAAGAAGADTNDASSYVQSVSVAGAASGSSTAPQPAGKVILNVQHPHYVPMVHPHRHRHVS